MIGQLDPCIQNCVNNIFLEPYSNSGCLRSPNFFKIFTCDSLFQVLGRVLTATLFIEIYSFQPCAVKMKGLPLQVCLKMFQILFASLKFVCVEMQKYLHFL